MQQPISHGLIVRDALIRTRNLKAADLETDHILAADCAAAIKLDLRRVTRQICQQDVTQLLDVHVRTVVQTA